MNNVRVLMCFEICGKTTYLGIWYPNPILGKVGVMHVLGWCLVWKPMVDFLFVLIELFSLSITVPESQGEMYTARLFSQEGPPLWTQILPGQDRPAINHSWPQKTRDTGLLDGENHIPLCSLVLTQYWSVMHRQRDSQMNRRTHLP